MSSRYIFTTDDSGGKGRSGKISQIHSDACLVILTCSLFTLLIVLWKENSKGGKIVSTLLQSPATPLFPFRKEGRRRRPSHFTFITCIAGVPQPLPTVPHTPVLPVVPSHPILIPDGSDGREAVL